MYMYLSYRIKLLKHTRKQRKVTGKQERKHEVTVIGASITKHLNGLELSKKVYLKHFSTTDCLKDFFQTSSRSFHPLCGNK